MTAATYRMRAHEHLRELADTITRFDGVIATLKDDRVEVLRVTLDGPRETVTCRPLPSACDVLWFFDGERRPVAPAHEVGWTASAMARRMTPQ